VFALVLTILVGFISKPLLTNLGNLAKFADVETLSNNSYVQMACTMLAGFIGILFGGWAHKIYSKWRAMHIGDKLTVYVGGLLGTIASLPILILIYSSLQLGHWGPAAMIIVLAVFTFLSIIALQSMDDILPWNRSNIRGKKSGIKILDTNVIIDGRIYDVARTGFIEGQLYVPGFVLEELQHIADSADALRRQRGRRGLEVLRHLQAEFPLEIRIHDRIVAGIPEVDSRLVRLARVLGADIVTNDFNLNRVAALQDVRVLNLNDLSLALRPNVLPQETLVLPLVREGNQHGQGVGYLEDGTMVVVENGRVHIGDTVEVVVTQVIQTERGKMIFAEALEATEPVPVESSVKKRTAPRRPY
jgi:uncharacterized protein YacL